MDHKPWHSGTFPGRSIRLRAAAAADPSTRCWRCGLTLAQVRRVKPRAVWTAGHLRDGDVTSPLAPECSPCNYGWGARRGNRLRRNGIRPDDPPPTVRW